MNNIVICDNCKTENTLKVYMGGNNNQTIKCGNCGNTLIIQRNVYNATKECKYCMQQIDSRAKICPICKRQLQQISLKGFFSALIITILILGVSFYCYYNYIYLEDGEYKITNIGDIEKRCSSNSISLISHEKNTSEYFYKIEGIIKNNSNYKCDTIIVTFNIYDKNNNNIGNCYDINYNLMSGETWKFEALCTSNKENINSYSLAEINAY